MLFKTVGTCLATGLRSLLLPSSGITSDVKAVSPKRCCSVWATGGLLTRLLNPGFDTDIDTDIFC